MREVERYALYDEIASGGMATVYLARLRGQTGFSRLVAMKALHAQYAKEEAFRAMFLDEARLVSRVRHPNVVPTIDVLESEGELFIVMDYVHGDSLSRLLAHAEKAKEPMPIGIVCSILIDTLEGLHAAHEATSEDGTPMVVVHRDVSPQNILVGVNGVAQVADFGIAKAAGRLSEKFSMHNAVKGKAGYMAPEQARGKADRRADVYAVGIVLWEALIGKKLFTGDSFLEIVTKALDANIAPPSTLRADVPPELDEVVRRAVVHDLASRYATAREMAVALEKVGMRATHREVGEWVAKIAHDSLERRGALIARIESGDAESPSIDVKVTAAKNERTQRETVLDRGNPGIAPITVLSGTISGEHKDPPASRRARIALGLGLVAASALGLFVYVHAHSSAPAIAEPIASSANASSLPPPPPISASAGNDTTAATPPPTATSSPSSSSITAPTSKHHAPARHDHSAPASNSKDAGGACHWEQLPDADGIMIPKKVCP